MSSKSNSSPSQTGSHSALFNLGFRPFFSGASIFAAVTMAYWLGFFFGFLPLNLGSLSPFQWHAHEMIYGYSVAVIAGFLLTAVKNWTDQQTPHGKPLVALFALWALARVSWLVDALIGPSLLVLTAAFDVLFIMALMVAVARPIIVVRQWRQLAILTKLILLCIGNVLFYLGLMGYVDTGVNLAIYGGLYLVIGLILTIGRRVVPFFIERGVDYKVELYNSRWIDIPSMVFFLIFFVSELFLDLPWLSHLMAVLMFFVTTVRLIGWYTPGIWKTPLLWSLFISLGFIDLGFILFATIKWLDLSPYLAVHAFAVGGIGLITLGMMARVSIGHTGRDLKTPPTVVPYVLGLLVGAGIIRVILPIVAPQYYFIWIAVSGLCWLAAFAGFAHAFMPIWSQPRPDQKYG